ncbi:hypothetical protein [Pikeienuella sp. HZG-20]|uniref:tetratricopeptide repeat protein n=1 Tax=Paludibacillus litoralis TaxID=3133267 RepID=UPI0030EE037A
MDFFAPFARLACALFLSLILSACFIQFDEPPFDPAEGVALAGDDALVVVLGKGGFPKKSKAGDEVGVLKLQQAGYLLSSEGDRSGGLTISFHEIPGRDGLLFMQFRDEGGDPWNGFFARMTGKREISIAALSLSAETKAALPHLGVEVGSDGAVKAKTAIQARMIIEAAFEDDSFDEMKTAGFTPFFRIASTRAEKERLRLAAYHDNCLAWAGHVYDPEVRKLAPDYRNGVPADEIEADAIDICRRAAALPGASPSVRIALARALQNNGGEREAREIIAELADDGDTLGAYLKTSFMALGDWPGATPDDGYREMAEAARAGNWIAGIVAADQSVNGSGALGPGEALNFALDGAKRHPGGYYAAGRILLYGTGVAADLPRAHDYFERASAADFAYGNLYYGMTLIYGWGVEKNFKKAVKPLERAREQELNWANYYLGYLYAYAGDDLKDERKAFSYFQKAHKADIADATAELGVRTYFGTGTKANPKEGRALVLAAMKEGSKSAKDFLNRIEKAEKGARARSTTRDESRGAAESPFPKTGYRKGNLLSAIYEGRTRGVDPAPYGFYLSTFATMFINAEDRACQVLVGPRARGALVALGSVDALQKILGPLFDAHKRGSDGRDDAFGDGMAAGLQGTLQGAEAEASAKADAQTFYNRHRCASPVAILFFQKFNAFVTSKR